MLYRPGLLILIGLSFAGCKIDLANQRESRELCAAQDVTCEQAEPLQDPVDQEPPPPAEPEPPKAVTFLTEPGHGAGLATSVTISGDAADAAKVEIFTNETCAGKPVRTVTAKDFKAGVAIAVPLGETTKFSAEAVGSTGLTSDCKAAALSYAQLAWKWEAGTDAGNDAGNYGSIGVASPSNYPGARSAGITLRDSKGNVWLFGGNGPAGWSDMNDLWKLDAVTGQWVWMSGSSTTTTTGVYGTKGVADAANFPCPHAAGGGWVDQNDNLYFFGGMTFNCNSYGNWKTTNDFWKYDTTTGLWTWLGGSATSSDNGVYGTKGVADAANFPGARYLYQLAVANDGKTVWLYGGSGKDATGGNGPLADLWRYDMATGLWTWMAGSDQIDQDAAFGTLGVADAAVHPGSVLEGVAWADPNGDFWLFGGTIRVAATAGTSNALWRFDAASGLWTWMHGASSLDPSAVDATVGEISATATPAASKHGVAWSDAQGDLWYAVGEDTAAMKSALWRYAREKGQWTLLSGADDGVAVEPNFVDKGKPSAAAKFGARKDSSSWVADGRVWLFGGQAYATDGSNPKRNDLWSLPLP